MANRRYLAQCSCWNRNPRVFRQSLSLSLRKAEWMDLAKDVLVLAGIQLMFCLVSSLVLCLGFGMSITLITLRCFSCCRAGLTQRTAQLLVLPCQPGAEGALGEDTARTAGPGCPKGHPTPWGVMLSNNTRVKKGGHSE